MFPHIQALRGVAILAVMIFHAEIPLPGGYLGVDVFFTISGFVITSMLMREYAKTRKLNWRTFILRRFYRLFPAAAIVVVVGTILSLALLSPFGAVQTASLTGFFAILGLANIPILVFNADYFAPDAKLNPFLHTWSLAVEEQFYVLFLGALMAAVILAKRRSFSSISLKFVAGLSLASFIALFLSRLGIDFHWSLTSFYSPFSRAWEFGAGALLAFIPIGRLRALPELGLRVSRAIGWVLLIFAFHTAGPEQYALSIQSLAAVVGASTLIVCGVAQAEKKFSPLNWPALVAVGNASYSLYLWHWPIVVLANVVAPDFGGQSALASLISIPLGFLSHRYVEERWRHNWHEYSPGKTREAAKVVIAATLVPFAVWAFTSQVVSPHISNANDPPILYSLGCHGPWPQSNQIEFCSWNQDGTQKLGSQVLLVGDSNAAQFASGLIAASNEHKFPLAATTASACPFIPGLVPFRGNTAKSEACANWQLEVKNFLLESEDSIVIMGFSSEYWFDEDTAFLLGDGTTVTDTSAKLELFRVSLRNTANELTEAGHRVFLVQPIPQWWGENSWSLAGCSTLQLIVGCNKTQDVRSHISRTAPLQESIDASLVGSQVALVDFTDEICPGGKCQTRNHSTWVYRDSTHLSNTFARSLAEIWAATLIPSSKP